MLIPQKHDQQKLDCESQNKGSDFLNIFKAGGKKKKKRWKENLNIKKDLRDTLTNYNIKTFFGVLISNT